MNNISLSNQDVEHIPYLCISKVPIFNHLPIDELAVIANKANMRTYERGQFIHSAGDVSDKLFIVHKGKVKVYWLSDGGKEHLVRILKPGDFIGELALFSPRNHDAYAETMQKSEICAISQSDVRDLLREYPDVGLHLLTEMSNRLTISEKQTAVIATESTNARLAQYLAFHSEKEGSDNFDLPMSRKYIASFLGTTPETVSRRLGEFEEAGWIKQKGQRNITILNLDALLLVD